GGEGVDAGGAGLEANAGGGGNFDGAGGRDGDFGLDDVLVPVAGASGNVARQRKVRQRGHGDVVGAANTGFQHAAAPDRYGVALAEVVDMPGLEMSADPAELDVDDFAGTKGSGFFGLLVWVDARVEADGRLQAFL